MSLKARLRLAVALLMSAMVVVLSGLYLTGFLRTAFTRTHEVAESLGNGLQAAVLDELGRRTVEANPRPATPEEAREFWLNIVENDAAIQDTLARAMRHWHLITEILITDENDRIRASSVANRAGTKGQFAPNLAEWTNRSVLENFRQVYWGPQLTEILRPIAVVGEKTPVLNIHVVVSTIFIRDEVTRGLWTVAWVCLACLAASLVLALVVPSVILSPLERLGHSIDLMATGQYSQPPKESKEFAAVYSKLNLLGQQYLGAQENVDQLRGNVEQMLERLEEAVLFFDASGHLTMAGRAVGHLLGRASVELIGKTIDEVFEGASEAGGLIHAAMDQGLAIRDHTVLVSNSEGDRSLIVSIQPLVRAHMGQRMGTLVTLRDAETRGELAAQLDMASRLTALSQLTRGVAHEIKNPLNAITLHLEILRTRLNGEAPEVGVISREISRLDRVVKTFLDYNRPVEPHLAPIDLNELTRDIAGLVTPVAESKNIQVDSRTTLHPAIMNGDSDLLKQAILNVVMNAVEAMKSGGKLTLITRRGRGQVELSVSDTGPGIPPEVQDRIFNLYFSTKEQGSGIGLAMAFRFVQLHDGRIDFSSEVGRGTTFRFSFPEVASPTQADIGLSRSHGA